MKRVPTKTTLVSANTKEIIGGDCKESSRKLKGPKIRRIAQHHLNGLRIAAFLIRHGFDRMKVRHFVSIYEDCIYPALYHDYEIGPKKKSN